MINPCQHAHQHTHADHRKESCENWPDRLSNVQYFFVSTSDVSMWLGCRELVNPSFSLQKYIYMNIYTYEFARAYIYTYKPIFITKWSLFRQTDSGASWCACVCAVGVCCVFCDRLLFFMFSSTHSSSPWSHPRFFLGQMIPFISMMMRIYNY